MKEEAVNEEITETEVDQASSAEDATSEESASGPQEEEGGGEDEEIEQEVGGEESLDAQFSEAQIQGLIEALIFTNGDPIGLGKLKRITGLPQNRLSDIIESIQMKFEIDDSGFRLVNAGGKYQFRTEQVFGPFIKRLKDEKPKKLTPAALETLAIVAYRQPIVKSDIEKIRGVDATPTIKTLIERRLIRIVGHQATVGQPSLYGTSDAFLKIFGLQSLSELPTLRDLRELEADPGEIEEYEETLDAETNESEQEIVNESEETSEDESNIVQLPSRNENSNGLEQQFPMVGND